MDTALPSILKDLKYSLRKLLKSPGLSVVALLTLTLGIGANTAIFTVVDSVLLKPLPFNESERLAVVWESYPERGGARDNFSPANFADLRRQSESYEQMAAAYYWSPSLTGVEQPSQLWGLRVSSNLFGMLRVQPALGRVFLPEEEAAGNHRVVVLGWDLWQRRFGSDQAILNRSLTLDGENYTVIGIMPQGFRFPPFWATRAEMWAPLGIANPEQRNGRMLRVFGRLKPGVPLERAQAEATAVAARLAREYPEANPGMNVIVEPLMETVTGDVRPALLVLQGAVLLLLVLACANLANLLLLRAIGQQKEFSIRLALGANRRNLLCQMLTDALLLTFTGGLMGVLLGWWVLDWLLRSLASTPHFALPRAAEIGMNAAVVALAMGSAAATACTAALISFFWLVRGSVAGSISSETRGGTAGRLTGRLQGALAASQVALSLVLLIGSGLLGKSFYQLIQVDPGFDASHVLTMSIAAPGIPDTESSKRPAVFREMTRRAAAAPGVESAGAINHLPLAGDQWGLSFTIAGRPVPGAGEIPSATWRAADAGYFLAMKLRLLKGRFFNDQDTGTSPPVVLINNSFARRYFAVEEPVGQRIRIGDPASGSPLLEIVGVVGNVKQQSWAEDSAPEMYVPLAQNQLWRMTRRVTLVARAKSDPSSIVGPLREAVSAAYKDAVISDEMPMEQVASQAVSQPRFQTLLLALFAAAAILLAAIGIYGIIAHSVSARVREMGIRQALGANRAHLLGLVLTQGAKLAVAGIVVGLAAGRVLSRFVESLVYQVSPADWAVYLGSAMFLAAVAMLASYIPARRASRIDPMAALRMH